VGSLQQGIGHELRTLDGQQRVEEDMPKFVLAVR
jgi:hypothetical protein